MTLSEELNKPEYTALVAAKNYPAIANILNQKPLIDNPSPISNIPKPLNVLTLVQAVSSQAELTAIKEVIDFPTLGEIARSNNRQRLAESLLLLQAVLGSNLSETTVNNIQAIIDEEIPDPSYQEQILGTSIAEQLGIYPVSASDVQLALNPMPVPQSIFFYPPQDEEVT